MRTATKATGMATAAHFIRESAARNAQRYHLCLAHSWSGCNVIVDELDADKTKRPCRGDCRACYQVLWEMVNAGTAQWEEFERAGICRPTRRGFQKRVLGVIVARRTP